MPSAVRIVDGQTSWEGGIDSGRLPTMSNPTTVTGLKRNQLAWLTNGTVRGGGILCRTGWLKRMTTGIDDALYQGGYVYEPDFGYPYIIVSIGGRIYIIHTDTDYSLEEITIPGDPNRADLDQCWMQQAEQFLVIQNGVELPLIWDGVILRRSDPFDPYGPEIPVGTCMDYYMGRLWLAINGREYTAGDIVGGPSGTAPYQFRDAVIKWTENLWLAGGGAFRVPTMAGDIRAIKHTANLDTALGQGLLFVFTRKAIYSLNVPVNRSEWVTMAETTQPIQRVAQLRYGAYGDRCIPAVNGDLFYQSTDGIRSLMLAVRWYHQWGQVPISKNENRVIQFNDRSLMRFSSGIEFDNRLLQTVLPIETPVGVAFQGVMPLDFDLITSMEERLPPVWEGMWEGLDFLQLFDGDFGGLHKAFAAVVSRVNGAIDLWQLTDTERFNQGDARTTFWFETPAFVWNDPFQMKRLDGAELWVDKIYGEVEFELSYRPDQDPCWYLWHAWKQCAARTECEDETAASVCYPTQTYCEQHRATMMLPAPPVQCQPENERPTNVGFQFQAKLVVRGWCRVRGLRLFAVPVEQAPFHRINC